MKTGWTDAASRELSALRRAQERTANACEAQARALRDIADVMLASTVENHPDTPKPSLGLGLIP